MADRPWRSGIAAVAVWAAAALPVSAQRGPVMPAYPAWFLDPPAGAASVAVPRYATAASSFAEARDSVREALGRIAHVRVRMTQRATQVEGVPLDLEPEQVRELVRDVPDSVVVLDSTIVGQMTFMLGAASARLLPGLGGAAVVPPAASPGWVTNPPAGLAGVGTAPVYVNEHTSWAEAEQRARAAVASVVMTRARASTRVQNGEGAALLMSDVRADLAGVRVVARWRGRRSVHVLVQAASAQPLS
ncbi:MAG: hypothetical protein ACK53A_11510 [Gemmatimonadota bacterium]|jgi:hypothetical protein